jgi:predicted AAA+ superfamily ATPase
LPTLDKIDPVIERSLRTKIRAALGDTPVVMLVGPRQAGKSTLASSAPVEGPPPTFISFDDPAELAAAQADPGGFVASLGDRVVLDEAQRAPEIFLPIKASVDRDRRPGRFLLTGSANPLFVPVVADALVGRMEVLTLWPFSGVELAGRPDVAICETLLAERPQLPETATSREELAARLVQGGFPEVVQRQDAERRKAWFDNYLTTILERDVRAVADISRLEQLPALLTAVALRSRGPLNKSGLSQDLAVPISSLDRYLALLERVFLVRRLRAWHNRLQPRLVKSPKMLIADSGLFCHLLRLDASRLLAEPTALGLALESYVGSELLKAVAVAREKTALMHYRTAKGTEIDFVLEGGDGRVAAVEVKASRSVEAGDLRRFERLRETLGPRFVRGVVLYSGERSLSFGDRLEAWPLSLLWGGS